MGNNHHRLFLRHNTDCDTEDLESTIRVHPSIFESCLQVRERFATRVESSVPELLKFWPSEYGMERVEYWGPGVDLARLPETREILLFRAQCTLCAWCLDELSFPACEVEVDVRSNR